MQRPNTPDGLFHNGDPATGTKGTPITAEWLNALVSVGAFLHGAAEPPGVDIGGPGDFYYCTGGSNNLYGPKGDDNTWPVAVRLKGPYKAYATLAVATADLANIPEDALIYINADATPANNGFYAKTSGALVPSSWDRVAAAEAKITSLQSYDAALDSKVFDYVPSKNLFNLATVRDGFYVSSNNPANIQATAGWGCSDFIPVTPNAYYTISGIRGRTGLAFFSGKSDNAGIAGSTNLGGLPLTVQAPSNAAYMVINLYYPTSPSYANVQVEVGQAATSYTPWIPPYPTIKKTALPPDVQLAAVAPWYEIVQPSKNLFNQATSRDGFYVSSADPAAIQATAGWGCSDFIPVIPGTYYTISGTRGRTGLAFFTAKSSNAAIAGSTNVLALPVTVRAPSNAAYLVINLYQTSSPSYANVQVEVGQSASSYEPYGPKPFLRKEAVYPTVLEEGATSGTYVVFGDPVNGSFIRATLGSDELIVGLNPLLPNLHTKSNIFQFGTDKWNSVPFHVGTDDAAPYRAGGTTIGAGHGYESSQCTVASHGKTLVDVGSVYRDGSLKEWVIVDVPDANTITVTARADNADFLGGTLTNSSGGTHTASFTPSAVVASQQWYPVVKNHLISATVDDIPVSLSGTFTYRKSMAIHESYEIINKASMVEWIITQVGTATNIVEYFGTSDLSVSISYVFDVFGNCTIYTDFLALNNVAAFQDIMFLQCSEFTPGVAGAVKFYVPKSLPFTHESVNYDFSTPRDMTGYSVTNRIDFTSDRCAPSGILCDRVIQMNDNVGLAVGYLPVRSTDPAVRRTNASRKALQISQAAKIYMSCIDNPGKTSLVAGDYFSTIGYRCFFKRSNTHISTYVVNSTEGTFLYCDWASATTERVSLPAGTVGKPFTIVEKSASVSVLSASGTNSVVFKTTGAGYAILRF
jgi:hypothetical protein